jgi:flavin reductase (DIM6/NTAB) family NADH-FMN oxidoreductase RutF
MERMIALDAENAPLDMLLKPFASIGHDWMLVTAGGSVSREGWNTMTASWGTLGVLWGRRVVTCVIRPSRHTYSFVEREPLVTFSFFDPSMKKSLEICGSTSGANTDKAASASLTPILLEKGAIGFAEARLNLVCGKIYAHDVSRAEFIDPTLDENYPDGDYHRMYACEILRAYRPTKED